MQNSRRFEPNRSICSVTEWNSAASSGMIVEKRYTMFL
jgi:hypothetical protein